MTSNTGVAVYSPCGSNGDAALNIKSQIKLSEPKNLNAHGLLTSDSIDSKLTQVGIWRYDLHSSDASRSTTSTGASVELSTKPAG